MLISILIFIIVVILWLSPFILCLIDHIKGTHYSCSIFGWHDGNLKSKTGKVFDGCSRIARCSKCGKEVSQDSCGDWF
jgi:hypothetical protein